MKPFRRLKVPTRGPRLVRGLFEEMRAQCIGVDDLAQRAGVAPETLKNWRKNQHAPMLAQLEACYGALGLELVPRTIKETPYDHAP